MGFIPALWTFLTTGATAAAPGAAAAAAPAAAAGGMSAGTAAGLGMAAGMGAAALMAPSAPKMPKPEPPAMAAGVAERAAEARRRRLYGGGRQSTIKTGRGAAGSPLGLPGPARTAAKTLTGA